MTAEAPTMIELEIRQTDAPRTLRFGPDRTVTIGRDDGCVLPIEDTAASRVHCVVTYRSGRWLLRDADSRNGTLVNRQEVQTRALLDGDVIRIGRTDIHVRIAHLLPVPIAPRPATPAPPPAPKPAPTPVAPPPPVEWEDPVEPSGASPQPRTFLLRAGSAAPTLILEAAPAASDPLLAAVAAPADPGTVAAEPATRSRGASIRTPAWTISLLVHGALILVASAIVVTMELVQPPRTFVVGLAAIDAEPGRKRLESTRPAPEELPSPEEARAVEPDDAVVQATPESLARAMKAPAEAGPVEGSMVLPAAFSAGKVGGRGAPGYRAEAGEPGRRELIERALAWLIEHQDPDGHWSADRFAERCGDAACQGPGKAIHDVGVTGLALLAFLGAGYRPGDGAFGVEIRNGLQWLIAAQTADGCIGPRRGKYMYSHAIGTLALCQAYAAGRSGLLRGPCVRAVDFLVTAQSLTGGWRYKPGESEADTSVTGWAILALRRAQQTGIEVPRTLFPKVLAWLSLVTDKNGHVGYQSALDLGSRPEDGLDRYPPREATTAMGLVTRMLCDSAGAGSAHPGSVALLITERPTWTEAGDDADMIAWLFTSMALSRIPHDGRNAWDGELVQIAGLHQEKEGCSSGSWPAAGPWASSGGRVYSTAVAVLALEAPGGGLLAGIDTDGTTKRPGRSR